jgi:hypothetical protein
MGVSSGKARGPPDAAFFVILVGGTLVILPANARRNCAGQPTLSVGGGLDQQTQLRGSGGEPTHIQHRVLLSFCSHLFASVLSCQTTTSAAPSKTATESKTAGHSRFGQGLAVCCDRAAACRGERALERSLFMPA